MLGNLRQRVLEGHGQEPTGSTGKYDDVIQKASSLNKNAPSCVITVFIQNHVLFEHSAGLDPWIQSPCPTLFAGLSVPDGSIAKFSVCILIRSFDKLSDKVNHNA